MNVVTSHRKVMPIKFEIKIFGKLSTSTLKYTHPAEIRSTWRPIFPDIVII